MLPQDWLRPIAVLSNPANIGIAHPVVLAAGALLLCAVLLRDRIESAASRASRHPVWCMAALAILPVALRLALLHRCPVPTPGGADDFAYLLLGDTLRHFRLANPMHPMRQFFEAVFILQEPTYSSIFPLGQGLVLAIGWIILGHPWAGVLISCAVFSALCYWMLLGWVRPEWALAGGLLASILFGPLCQWTNLYWGGFVSAIAGCLVFGSIPRLQSDSRRPALVLGLGLGLQLLSRPFEFVLLVLCIAPFLWKPRRRVFLSLLALLPAVVLLLLHNHAVTHRWDVMPYQMSRYQYGVPATFTIQPNPVPHRELTAEQELDYRAQCIIHGDGPETLRSYAERWVDRLHFYQFFFFAPLYLALPAFLWTLRERRSWWILLTIAIFSLGTNFYPYFYPHYIAVITCLFVLLTVIGLGRLRRKSAIAVILGLCGVEFLFWYGLHAFAPEPVLNALGQYEEMDFINHGDDEGRIAVNQRLALAPGKQLVFVRYGPKHAFHEWIHNDADIDRARVVWAADMGTDIDEILRHYYPDRKVWIVEPDAQPPRLLPYVAPTVPEPEAKAPAVEEPKGPPPPLRFDDGSVNNPGGIQEVRKKRH